MEWIQFIPPIITAIGTIVLGWFTYNQYTKNKQTDLKIERMQEQNKITNKRRVDNGMIVYGEIWELLVTMKADRVYIVQPHPLGDEEKLSIYFEVKQKGVEPMKPHIRRLKISEVAGFASNLAKTPFQYIENVDEQVEDRYARSKFATCGTRRVVIKKLFDNTHDWVGSIFLEYIDDNVEIDIQAIHDALHKCATNTQYILPPIIDDED